jgi:ribosome-associated heat shock protein Hsp15
MTAGCERQRIDRWLFFARIAKSRSLAARITAEGQVRINREKVAKASAEVAAGDVVTVAIHGRVRVLKVRAPGSRRGPAPEAELLYEDLGAARKHVSTP